MKGLLIPVIVFAVATACVREEPQPTDPAPAKEDGMLHAYIVNPGESRTDFDGYAGKFAWSEGDKIALHLSDGSFYETAVDPETGAFTCSTTPSKQRDAYAVFPASARDADNYGSPELKITLPAQYDIYKDPASDYSPVPMIAVNRQGEDDLYFRHVGGLLRITCDRVPSQTSYIAVTFDRNVAGTFTVSNPASDSPAILEGGDSPTVTFRIAADRLNERTSGFVLNVPVPAGTYSSVKVAALKNNRMEIQAAERDLAVSLPCGHGKKLSCNIIPAYYDSMQLVVIANEESEYSAVFGDPASNVWYPGDLTIQWGDGTSDEYKEGYNGPRPSHTYATEGEYTITISAVGESPDKAMMPTMSFNRNPSNSNSYKNKTLVKSMPTPFLRYDSRGASSIFYGCPSLESVCGDLFSKNPQITQFGQTFMNCTALKEIPEDLFSYAPEVYYFAQTFSGCTGLTGSIPEKLFAHNPEAVSFEGTFEDCKNLTGGIPAKLFANNTKATSFQQTFEGCSNLTGNIPSALFSNNTKVRSFDRTFSGCSGLAGSIPATLFANNPNVTTFWCTFWGCSGLSGSIPENLFFNNTAVTTFSGTFAGCSGLTGSIPKNLFAAQTKVTDFSTVLGGCKGLTGSIPEDLFVTNPDVTDFGDSFENCSGLTGSIPEDLFAVHTAVTNFYGTFRECKNLSGPIPAKLFASQTAVTRFDFTFAWCSELTGTIPEDLFATNPNVKSFVCTFNSCAKLSGLPAGLFAHQATVTNFEGTFRFCSGLTGSIPAGFFENNPLATTFRCTFDYCRNLQVTPDIFTGIQGENPHWTPATRFKDCTVPVSFEWCFSGTAGGTAPNLWDYTYGNDRISTSCFAKGSNTSADWSNWSDIPLEWKRN